MHLPFFLLIQTALKVTSMCSHKFPIRFESSKNDDEELFIDIARPEEFDEIAEYNAEMLRLMSISTTNPLSSI